jgi:cytochrome c
MKMRFSIIFFLTMASPVTQALADNGSGGVPGDAGAGKAAFRQCTACHSIGKGAANGMGPKLTGVVGRPAASVDGFGYSDAMKKAGEQGLVWTPKSLDAFLSGPHDFVPGTKMPDLKVPGANRANIIAYLKTFSPDFRPDAKVSTYTPPH